MYSDPAALKIYSEFSGMPETVVRRVRELMPKDSMATDQIVGIDQVMAEAVQNKFLAAPLTAAQIADLVRASELK
jgi:NitT/TauT family transport system substrate-binding protein